MPLYHAGHTQGCRKLRNEPTRGSSQLVEVWQVYCNLQDVPVTAGRLVPAGVVRYNMYVGFDAAFICPAIKISAAPSRVAPCFIT
jgi:hypothetical protein